MAPLFNRLGPRPVAKTRMIPPTITKSVEKNATVVPPVEEVEANTITPTEIPNRPGEITLCTVHFNTPELLDALLKSIELHVPSFHLYVFDNSDKLPYHTDNPNVTIIDNTRGQIINFDKWLEGYPNRFKSKGAALSNWGTAKHTYTIQKCIELIDDCFILLDSDVLLKRDITPLFDSKFIFVGETTVEPWLKTRRVHPYVCYINTKMCRERGIKYFDEKRTYGLCTSDNPKDYEEYDTGGSFFVDASKHPYREIKCSDYVVHYGAGSWVEDNKKIVKNKPNVSDWLSTNKRYWDFNPDALIVTMTTWKPRIGKVMTAIQSILSNTRKPDKFILNLSAEEFPQKEKELPQELLRFATNRQIELNWVGFNSKQFKKSYPTLLDYPQNPIISVDDDVDYPRDFIDRLYKAYITNGRTQPVAADSVLWDNAIYSHHGRGTIFERKFFGPYLEVLYNDLIVPELKKGSKYLRDDLFYTYCALLNNVRYRTIQLDLNKHNIKGLNNVQPISAGVKIVNPDLYHSSYQSFIFNRFNKTYEALIGKQMKKSCVCTILTDSFIKGGEALIYSFYKNNPSFNGDFIVLHCDGYSPLSAEAIKRLHRAFPNIVFTKINPRPYDKIVESKILPAKFIPPIIKFEVFNLSGVYQHLVYLDSDTIVVGDISELLNTPHNVTLFTHNDVTINGYESPRQDRFKKIPNLVNNGVIALNNTNRKLVGVYSNLLKESQKYNKRCGYYRGCPDQDIMEHVLLSTPALDVALYKNKYNTLKRVFKGRQYVPGDIRVLHYVESNKPWNSTPQEYTSVDKVWHGIYNEFLNSQKIKPLNGRVVVGTVMKSDEYNPRDFVDYYIGLGFDQVVLYDACDSASARSTLKEYIDTGVVSYKRVPSGTTLQKVTMTGVTCDWSLLIELNEYLTFNPKYESNVKNLLGDERFKRFSGIVLGVLPYQVDAGSYNKSLPIYSQTIVGVIPPSQEVRTLNNEKAPTGHTLPSNTLGQPFQGTTVEACENNNTSNARINRYVKNTQTNK